MCHHQIYVHSKVLIMDDRLAFIGSSNVNDRSLLADTDSELCVAISGGEEVPVYMNGTRVVASRFVHTLRTRLWREHLGLLDAVSSEGIDVSDPVAAATYDLLWRGRAHRNTLYYEKHFPGTRRYTAMYTDGELATTAVPHAPQGHVVSFAAQYMKGENMIPPLFKVIPLSVFH